jgi:hypothetical protein
MSRLLAATLLSAVSIAHAQNCVPIAPDATGSAVVGPKYRKVTYEDRDVRLSGRRCWTRDTAEVSS